MEASCPYCYELFNEQTNLPIKLRCSHVICKDCALYLRDFMNPNSCPFDQILVDFTKLIIDEQTISSLRNLCQKHNQEITGICMIHYSKLCKVCAESHADCKTLNEESFAKLNDKINELIRATRDENSREKFLFHCLGFGAFSNEVTWLKEEYNEFEQAIRPLQSPVEGLSQEKKIELIKSLNFIEQISVEALNKRNSILLNGPREGSLQNEECKIPDLANTEEFKKISIANLTAIITEIKLVRKTYNTLHYFKGIQISNELFSSFLAMFHNISNNKYLIAGVGIGIPTLPQTSSYVTFSISSEIGKIVYKEEILLEYTESRLTQCVPIKEPVVLNPRSSLIFHVEIDGENFNLFIMPAANNIVKVTDYDGSDYSLPFPILYLAVNLIL